MQTRTVPSVSVVMPAYNAERYLREAIDSTLAQTYTDFELIIINDGSTDATKDIILSYSDSRIVYLENEQNSGICVTLNKGLDTARGRYIARMDADDIMMPERLAVQVAYMDAHPEIGASGSDVIDFGEDIKEITSQQIYQSYDCAAGLLFNPCFVHPSVIIRKSILDKYNIIYNDEYRGLEDFKMWWDIAQYSKIVNIPKVLLKYRHHTNQETRNRNPQVYIASNKFRVIRYNSFGLKLASTECDLVNNYSYGNFESFGLDEINKFIDILSRVCKSKKQPIITTHKALQTACGKAVAFTIFQSPQLAGYKLKGLTKGLAKGVITPIWYLKYLKAIF